MLEMMTKDCRAAALGGHLPDNTPKVNVDFDRKKQLYIFLSDENHFHFDF